ncbi:hypothetical protein ACOSQ4_022591 [Xanthoceras sorbifolium]
MGQCILKGRASVSSKPEARGFGPPACDIPLNFRRVILNATPPKPLILFVPTKIVHRQPSTIRLTTVESIATKTTMISSPVLNKRREEVTVSFLFHPFRFCLNEYFLFVNFVGFAWGVFLSCF